MYWARSSLKIGKDLPSVLELQNYALPHNKLREHLKQVGTRLNLLLLPAPELLPKKIPTKKTNKIHRRLLLCSHLEVLVAQHVLSGMSIKCWEGQSFPCVRHTQSLVTEYTLKGRNITSFIQDKLADICSILLSASSSAVSQIVL